MTSPTASADTGELKTSLPVLRGTGLVIAGMFSQQFGAAIATTLFPRAGAIGVVTLRLTISAIVLLVICRPKVRGYTCRDWTIIIGFGVALAAMNSLLYQAIAKIPLGPAVTLEFLGPLVLSVIVARTARSWLWAALAFLGVALLGRNGLQGLNLSGAAFALGAAAMWAAYILLSARAGTRFPKVDGLALAMTVGAALSIPIGLAHSGSALFDPTVLVVGAAVAIMSSVLPYAFELMSLRQLPPATFSILMSLAPAVAALAGYLVAGQELAPADLAAIGCVVIASVAVVRGVVRNESQPPLSQ